MNYVEMNGLKISKLTLGTAQLGFDYGIANKEGQPGAKQSNKILKTAVEGGITSFDTAPAYGESEKVLGTYFSNNRSKLTKPVITTKLEDVYNGDKKEIDKNISKQVTSSCQILGLKSLPVLLLHNMRDLRKAQKEIVDSMLRLKEEGLVNNIGVSVYDPRDVEEVLKINKFDAIQIPINILDHRLINTGLLGELKDAGLIVFARSVFLQGIFFIDVKQLPAEMSFAREAISSLRKLSRREKISMAQLAVTFVRDLEGISSLVIGSEKPEQVEENIKLIKKPELAADIREEIMETFKNIPEKLINPSLW